MKAIYAQGVQAKYVETPAQPAPVQPTPGTQVAPTQAPLPAKPVEPQVKKEELAAKPAEPMANQGLPDLKAPVSQEPQKKMPVVLPIPPELMKKA